MSAPPEKDSSVGENSGNDDVIPWLSIGLGLGIGIIIFGGIILMGCKPRAHERQNSSQSSQDMRRHDDHESLRTVSLRSDVPLLIPPPSVPPWQTSSVDRKEWLRLHAGVVTPPKEQRQKLHHQFPLLMIVAAVSPVTVSWLQLLQDPIQWIEKERTRFQVELTSLLAVCENGFRTNHNVLRIWTRIGCPQRVLFDGRSPSDMDHVPIVTNPIQHVFA
eukprot:PhF_6_TR9074/c0_g1_i1/m.14145